MKKGTKKHRGNKLPEVSGLEEGRLLVVDDEEDFRTVVAEHLEDLGHHVTSAADGEAAATLARRRSFDVALVDMKMPGMSGIELLERLQEIDSGLEVILITGHATVETAVGAMKKGAYDYLLKPCRLSELEDAVAGALEKRRLWLESTRLREQIRRIEPSAELVGTSGAIVEVRRLVERVAATESTVLVLGESGTGKELVARALHHGSSRSGGSFVVLHAGAIPEGLVESELFGHVRGAFTSAAEPRRGALELADKGTLFIDEIGEMPLAAQAKLLRVLESGTVRPVGGERELTVNVRFLAATNRNLHKMTLEGSFRTDLYYRLNVFHIEIPPLRDRLEDIPLLANHFQTTAPISRARDYRIQPEALEALAAYRWPGNVRELFNVLERAVILSSGTITLDHLPQEVLEAVQARGVSEVRPMQENGTPAPDATRESGGKASFSAKPSEQTLDLAAVERTHILRVLQMTGGNKVAAAKLLKMPRRTLYRRLKEYGIGRKQTA